MLPVRLSRIRSPRFPTRAHPRPRMTPALSIELRVSNSGGRLIPTYLQFRRLRQAACAFAQVPLDSHVCPWRRVPNTSGLCIACLAEDECPTSFESLLRRLAHTIANLRCLSNLHLPARAGNARFQFATWLPTDGTMRLPNL